MNLKNILLSKRSLTPSSKGKKIKTRLALERKGKRRWE
jgi:hypothetical protein